jgi:hypothetical protein
MAVLIQTANFRMVASRKLSDSHRSDQYREIGAVGTLAVQFAKRLEGTDR